MFNSFNEMMEEIFKKDKKIADLEAKLAESEKIIKNNSHNKWLKAEAERYKTEYQSLKGYIDQLKQQLAEKDQERELLIDQFEEETEKLRKQIKQESDARKRFVEANKQLKQLQNQTAIAELEKLRKQLDCENNYCYGDNNIVICVNRTIFNDIIDQQIKSLKGEK